METRGALINARRAAHHSTGVGGGGGVSGSLPRMPRMRCGQELTDRSREEKKENLSCISSPTSTRTHFYYYDSKRKQKCYCLF
jgi:hypothetical protein